MVKKINFSLIYFIKNLFKPYFFSEIEKKCNYLFKNKNYLIQAFSHKSISTKPRDNYERLEFLGDAVIDIVISRELMREFPEGDEGILTQKRSALVQKSFLASMGKLLNLLDFINIESNSSCLAIPSIIHVLENIRRGSRFRSESKSSSDLYFLWSSDDEWGSKRTTSD